MLTTTLDEVGCIYNQRAGNKATSRLGGHWWTAVDDPDLATDQKVGGFESLRARSISQLKIFIRIYVRLIIYFFATCLSQEIGERGLASI